MADPTRNPKDANPPSEVHVDGKKTNWLAWLALAAGIIALLVFLSRRSDEAIVEPVQVENVAMAEPVAVDPVATVATVAGVSALGAFLAGTEATPRTFALERVNFATASSEVAAADASELTEVAGVLKQYPASRVRVAGYADARGDAAANATLGKSRADSVKAALVAAGIDASRIETATGGEADPVDTNATGGGQAENRRTELVVLQR